MTATARRRRRPLSVLRSRPLLLGCHTLVRRCELFDPDLLDEQDPFEIDAQAEHLFEQGNRGVGPGAGGAARTLAQCRPTLLPSDRLYQAAISTGSPIPAGPMTNKTPMTLSRSTTTTPNWTTSSRRGRRGGDGLACPRWCPSGFLPNCSMRSAAVLKPTTDRCPPGSAAPPNTNSATQPDTAAPRSPHGFHDGPVRCNCPGLGSAHSRARRISGRQCGSRTDDGRRMTWQAA